MAGVVTWDALPAVQAGQLVGFSAVSTWVYEQNAKEIEAIAAAVRAANPHLIRLPGQLVQQGADGQSAGLRRGGQAVPDMHGHL